MEVLADWVSRISNVVWNGLLLYLLVGTGIVFTIRTRFIQVRKFGAGWKHLFGHFSLNGEKAGKDGMSPFQALTTAIAAQVGTGNIAGAATALYSGGPGAIFWMWISAFAGMATSFGEATLAQIYKEKKGDEYVGGFTFYIQKIWKNKAWVGAGMCILYLLYNMLSIPVHTFHVFTAASSIANEVTGRVTQVSEPLYYVIAAAIVVIIAVITFGGIKSVVRFSDRAVPVMAALYIAVIALLIILNLNKVPAFVAAVFGGAFKPSAVFGGAFGVAMAQGLKRGLLSNEAGMGTATQASSIADANHPCEQGFVQAIGVFVDTIVICSLTGFVITAGTIWENPGIDWDTLKLDKIGTFLTSVKELVPGTAMDTAALIFVAIAFGLFAFTTLLCDLTYAEIAANKISTSKSFIGFVRVLGALFFVPLGTITVLAGLQLDNLWYVSDLINVVLVFINIPTLLMARNIILNAYKNYKCSGGRRFVSSDIGIETDVWR